jgi:hypothetical protein
MARETISLSAEVTEILREVAREPGATLLKVARKDVVRAVLESDLLAHARAAGRSAAEQHLVAVHREEVAFALRQAAYLRLLESRPSSAFMADRALAPHGQDPWTTRDVKAAAVRALDGCEEHSAGEMALELLEHCVAPDTQSWPDAGQLAAAAHALVPTNASRSYASLHLRAIGQKGAAVRPLQVVVELAASGPDAVVGWTNMADLLFESDHVREAAAAAEHGCALDPASILPQVNRVMPTLLLRGSNAVARMLDELEASLSSDPARAARYIAWCRSTPPAAHGRARTGLKSALVDIDFRRCPLASQVLHALSK